MKLRLSGEATKELERIRLLDSLVAAAVEESIEFLKLEVDEFDGDLGFSIEQLMQPKQQRGADVFRLKNTEFMPDLRILFFRYRKGIFVTGIHGRNGVYEPLGDAMTRLMRYWGMRITL